MLVFKPFPIFLELKNIQKSPQASLLAVIAGTERQVAVKLPAML